jgi:hypothetical protein
MIIIKKEFRMTYNPDKQFEDDYKEYIREDIDKSFAEYLSQADEDFEEWRYDRAISEDE